MGSIHDDYTLTTIGATANGVRLRFQVDLVPPEAIVTQHVRTRGWWEGSEWEGEEDVDEWKFGEHFEAWVVGKEGPP
jgi:hypothetical protein